MVKCDGIIFDVDGTLWDSTDIVKDAWNKAFVDSGYEDPKITSDRLKGLFGLPMEDIIKDVFPNGSDEEIEKLTPVIYGYEDDFLRDNGGVLYDGIIDTIKKLSESVPVYIVSNCQSGYIEAFLGYYDLGKYFDDIECYGNNLKNKGDNIALIAERNSLDMAWYIGDIQGDYDSAMQAGTGFIHAAYGFGSIDSPVPELMRFTDLPALMKSVCGTLPSAGNRTN